MTTKREPREPQPWDKRKGEGLKAHEAFRQFLSLEGKRSLTQVAYDRKVSREMIRRWSSKWEWTARSKAWDDHIANIKQDAAERAARETAELWTRRRLERADKNWKHAAEIEEWATNALIKAPMFEREVETTQLVDAIDVDTGRAVRVNVPTTIIVKASKWSVQTILDAFKTSALLGAAAVQEATQGVLEDDGYDPATATVQETKAWLAKKGVKSLPAPS